MSNIKDFLSGMVTPPMTRAIIESTAYTPFRDEWVLLILIGAGGSGAMCHSISSQDYAAAQGGSAGGTVFQLARLKQGVEYTVTIGAGGAARSSSSGGYNSAGAAGENTTFSGTGFSTITALGGPGGGVYLVNPTVALTYYNLTRQTVSGSGGDDQYAGGSGGAITYRNNGTGTQPTFASGGGAPNLLGIASADCDGGYIIADNVSGLDVEVMSATGGGGGGGTGGVLIHTSSVTDYNSGGGGAAGPGDYFGNGGVGQWFTFDSPAYIPTGVGGEGDPTTPTDGGHGAGGGATIGATYAGDSQSLGGGGANARYDSTSSIAKHAGNGGYGGGGGGCAHKCSDVNSDSSGAGGSGCCFIYSLGYYTE